MKDIATKSATSQICQSLCNIIKTQAMIKPTKQLNEIIRCFSKDNANTSISQLSAVIDLCLKARIRFAFDKNYQNELALFINSKYPEWNTEITNKEIESLVKYGKYEEAADRRDKAISVKKEMHKQFKLSKFGTEDWFIENSESEIFFIPTEIGVIDSLMSEKAFEK